MDSVAPAVQGAGAKSVSMQMPPHVQAVARSLPFDSMCKMMGDMYGTTVTANPQQFFQAQSNQFKGGTTRKVCRYSLPFWNQLICPCCKLACYINCAQPRLTRVLLLLQEERSVSKPKPRHKAFRSARLILWCFLFLAFTEA